MSDKLMTKDEFYDFLVTEEGEYIDEFITDANTVLQEQFLPEFFRDGDDQENASDFIYCLLCDLLADALYIYLNSGICSGQRETEVVG